MPSARLRRTERGGARIEATFSFPRSPVQNLPPHPPVMPIELTEQAGALDWQDRIH